MDTTDHGFQLPLNFMLEQSVRFDRPVDPERDFVVPGSCEVEMLDEDGSLKVVAFDFERAEGAVDEEDPCVVHCVQRIPDLDTFEDMSAITEHMLRNVSEVIEWNIETDGSYEDEESFVRPVEVIDAEFVIVGDAASNGTRPVHIPIPTPITPRWA